MESLYLIRCNNEFYKIGIANDLESRLASLQTGNPYPLVVEACFEFPNAGFVEKALHQKFRGVRKLGEWFRLSGENVSEFLTLCRLLGGMESRVSTELANETQIEEAEESAEPVEGAKWDYEAMFKDGWRIERSNSNTKRDYWAWRRGGGNVGREYLYGGRIIDLPRPLEGMQAWRREATESEVL